MKIETSDEPIVKTPKYQKHLEALTNGKSLINFSFLGRFDMQLFPKMLVTPENMMETSWG